MINSIIRFIVRMALVRYGASATEAQQLAPEVIAQFKGVVELFKKLKAIGTPPERAAAIVGHSITKPSDFYAGMTPAEAAVFFDRGTGG